MALELNEKEWLEGYIPGPPPWDKVRGPNAKPSVVAEIAEYEEVQKVKQARLTKARDLIELCKEDIRKANDVTYEIERRFLPNSKKKAMVKEGDGSILGIGGAKYDSMPELEHSRESDKGKLRPDQQKALNMVMDELRVLTEEILAHKEGEKTPIDPNELMEEIWTPLVREQIIPEDQAPDAYSRIRKLWDGASKLYKERIKEKGRKTSEAMALAQDAMELAQDGAEVGGTIADAVLEIIGAKVDTKKMAKLITTCVKGGIGIVQAGLEAGAENKFKGIGEKVGEILGAVLGHYISSQVGTIAKASCSGLVKIVPIVKAIKNKDPRGVFDEIADAIGVTLGCFDNDDTDGMYAYIGTIVTNSLKGGSGAAMVGKKLIEGAPPEEIMAEIGVVVQSAVKIGVASAAKKLKEKENKEMKKKIDEAEDDDEKNELEEEKKQLEMDQESRDEELDKYTDKYKDVLENFGKALKGPDLEKAQKKAEKKVGESADAELEEAQKTFEKQLAVAFNVGVEAESPEEQAAIQQLYSIDALIQQLERDKAIFEMVNMLIEATAGVVGQFVPWLGGPMKAKAFVMNVVAAVKRGKELKKFSVIIVDARKATSPQAHALIAQADELSRQLTDDILDAAFNLAEAIAATAAACGVKEALAVEKGLAAAHALKDFLMKAYKKYKVHVAWRKFKKADRDPKNRLAIMAAFRTNPTLAKYCIAYGALEMGDPFAKEILRQSGLNDMVLASEGANAEKVVTYLELQFSDDIVVEGVYSTFVKVSGDPLSPVNWDKNKAAAVKAGWTSEPTSAINAALGKVSQLKRKCEALGVNSDPAPWEEYKKECLALAAALRAFKPTQATKPETLQQFREYLDDMASAADKRAQSAGETFSEAKLARDTKKKIAERTKTEAEAGVLELDACLTAVTNLKNTLTVEAVVNFCTAGEFFTKFTAVKARGSVSVTLNPPLGFLEKRVGFTLRQANSASKLAEQDRPNALKQAIESLESELTDCKSAFSAFVSQATEELAALS